MTLPLNTSSHIDPEEAVARGHDIWEVAINEWARTIRDVFPLAANGSATGLRKSFPITPFGMIIGPTSTVDRCWVTWNTQRTTPTSGARGIARLLSVDTPLLFAQPAGTSVPTLDPATAPLPIIDEAQNKNTLMVFPHLQVDVNPWLLPQGIASTVTPDNYTQADGTVVAFGNEGAGEVVGRNVLHLVFLLKPLLGPVPKRAPYQNRATRQGIGQSLTRTVGLFPTYGRKDIIIQAVSDKAESQFTIGALRAMNPIVPVFETIEGQKTAALANESLRFQFCSPAADWIVAYVTTAAFGGGGSTATVTITAYD